MILQARALTSGLLLLAALPAQTATTAVRHEPVAIVYRMTGEAPRLEPGPSREPVRLFDRLPAGVTFEVAPSARLALAFVNGKRYGISGPARVTLGKGDLAARSGGVRALPSVPPLPRLAPIAEDDDPGPGAGAVRLRGDADQARAREALLRWAQAAGADDDLRLLDGVDRALGLAEDASRATEDGGCPLTLPGLVVETVAPESAAFRAGLMPGDRLLSWCRTSSEERGCIARGDLRTPFDWLDVQMDDVQRGGVVVEGTRASEKHRWNLLPTFQGLTVAPLLQGALAETYQSSRERAQAGDAASAAKTLERAAELAGNRHCASTALWLLAQAAELHAKARQWTEADAAYQAALSKAAAAAGDRVQEHLRMSWSEKLTQRGDAKRARQQLESALALEEKDHPDGLGVGTLLTRIGNVIKNLQDDQDEADRLYQRAHELVLRAAPGSGAEAAAANNLALSAYTRGDLEQAQRHAARALALREQLTPAGDAITPSLMIYGDVLYARGDLAGAEALFLRAQKILERFQPASVPLAKTLHDLGMVAYQRGDDEAAESLFRRELALFEKAAPQGSQMRDSLIGLGEVALQRRQGSRAEEWWQRALAISEKLNPRGPKTAWCLGGLAEAARLQGRGIESGKLLRRALAIWETINPEAVDAASSHLRLGTLLLERGKPGGAEAEIRTGIRIEEKNRLLWPEGYHALARLQAREGKLEEAAVSYGMAVDSLEARRPHLGGAQESQWLYGSSLGDLYFEAAENQIALARPQEAWRLVERGRARGFQKMLAQRDLRFASEIPAPLHAERRRLDTEYDQAQAALVAWLPEQGAEKREALEDRLRDLRREQTGVQERILRSSPRIASLESRPALDLAAARSTLGPGTVLLEYAVGAEKTRLFVVQPAGRAGPGLAVFPIAAGQKALREQVAAFRRLLADPGSDRSALQGRARRLYDLLVRPAENQITGAQRILVSPDGPLHTLPFAALRRGDRYLVEWKPLHFAVSATVYAELAHSRPAPRQPSEEPLVALGDPAYPNTATDVPADPEVRETLRRGWTLTPLPFSRKEVEGIAALYPHSQVYLGQEATEERAKSLGPEARLVHFACHGLLDERFPLNSALALTLPEHPKEGQDNGLLQAWEVFESVRLDADLVTLSACDTALGKEMGGEGLIGLTRAFQYAGARSVLASLWGVADYSTAAFMKDFYGYLSRGKAKDEALQAAQIDQLRKKSALSHPFFWAAFELSGDWR
jgi:CHAT domain-containing protein/Tfp pilus assembly protein PilF